VDYRAGLQEDIAAGESDPDRRREAARPIQGEHGFYISTTHLTEKGLAIVMAGQHQVPFGKDYMISLIMISPVDKSATLENEEIALAFNSFHLSGQNPLR
jgi:hypothetical protein